MSTDIAALSLSVKFDDVDKSATALRKQTEAASASERAAKKWGASTDAAGRSADEFSKRVQRNIAALEFERQQLGRNATEQARFAALKRAGVSAASAEGEAISASVRALAEEKSARAAAQQMAQQQAAAFAALAKSQEEDARKTREQAEAVKRLVSDLEFERAQLARTSAERAKYSALRNAGVSEDSAQGKSIAASVQALQAQKAAMAQNALAIAEREKAFKADAATQERSRQAVAGVLQDLTFEREQLARTAVERAKFAALRQAGVSADSAEGRAIAASVSALQAQESALAKTAARTREAQQASASFFSQWKGLLAIGAGTFGASAIMKAVDAFTALTNQLKVTGASASAIVAIQDRLFRSANDNGVAIDALGQLYGRTALAGKELGVSQETLLQFTEGVTAALKVQGGSTEAASGALLQLSQALGSGIVRAEEFNSILEGALPIAQAAARGMDGMQGSVARLRTAVIAGTVTSKAFFDATMRGFDETKKQAASAQLTIGQSVTSLNNSFINYVGQIDKASGASKTLANAIAGISKAMDDAAKKTAAGDDGMFSISKMIEATGKEIAGIDKWTNKGVEAVQGFAKRAGLWVTGFLDQVSVAGAGASAAFVEAFRAMPGALGQLFTNAWQTALAKTKGGINDITAWLNANVPDVLSWLRPNPTQFDTSVKGVADPFAGIAERMAAASEKARAEVQAQIERQKQLDRQAAMEGEERRARVGGLLESGPLGLSGGSATAAAGKEAQNAAKKYADLTAELELAAAAQERMTAAAARGEQAFEQQKATLDAQQKMLDIFGKKLDDTDPKLTKIRDLMLSIAQGKVAEAFNVATTELEKQNVILAKQIELMGQSPEIIAREIALLQARQEAEKAGTAVTQDMIDARSKAIEQNETLKNQQEELKRAQDLWTAPLDIQSTAADAFEEMFQSGKINFESLADVFKKMVARMAAEFLALATVRPVMSVILNAVSPGMAREMGLGGVGGGTGGAAPGLGSMNVGNGSFFGSIGDWLSTPLTGPYAGMSPSSMAGVPTLSPSGTGVAGTGITALGAIGALAGAGMGIYGLATSKNTAQTIGGIASLVGAGVSLIPGIGQIAGPIIGLLGGLLPGLFGSTPEPPTNRAISSLNFSGGQFVQSGGSYGMDATDLGGLGTSLKSLLDTAKVKLTSSGYGLQQQSYSKGDFSNATTFITGPDGAMMQWGQSSDPQQQQKALDTAAAHIAHKIMLEVDSGISGVLREGLANFGQQNLQHAFSMDELNAAVGKLNALDAAMASFGKTSSEAEAAIAQVDAQFQTLFDTAQEFNLSASIVGQITAERDRQRLEATKDFTSSISQSILEITDPLQAELAALDKQKAADLKNNADFVRLVEGYTDQAASIEQLYYLRRNKIMEEANAQALSAQRSLVDSITANVSRIQDLLNALSPAGALGNADPATQLAAMRANAAASYAQAMADPANQALIEQAVADAQTLTETSLKYNAGGSAYEHDRQMQLGLLQTLQEATAGAGINQATDPEMKELMRQLLVVLSGLAAGPERDAASTTLTNLMVKYFADEARR